MVKNDTKASIREVYGLVEEMRKEITTSINRLESKFDNLEAGRLSSLEKDFANLQGRLTIVAGMVSFGINILFFVFNFFLK